MSLWVLYTCKGDFRTYESGWYHGVHDRLQEGHWESPGWCRWGSLIHHAFPCLLQIPTQFLVGPAQLFIPCLRRIQVNMDAFLIHFGRCHRLLKGAHRVQDLLHDDVFPSVRWDGSLPRVPHIVGSLLYTCEWDQVLNGPTVGTKCSCQLTRLSIDSNDVITPSYLCLGLRFP